MTDVPAKPKKVLLIEDNKDLSAAVCGLLGIKGVDVTAVRDGVSGLEAARREKPSLILLDIMLPKLSGFDVCRTLKSDPVTRRIPVVVVSTLSKPSDAERAKSCGADHFITKPYDMDELIREVLKILKLGT